MILFCCNRLAPSLELTFTMQAVARAGARPIALLESENLLNLLPPDRLRDIEIVLLPNLLRRYGVLTLPRAIGFVGKCFRLLGIDSVADILATLRGLITGQRALARLRQLYPVEAIVVADDRSLGWEYGVLLSGRRLGIRSIGVPFALSDPDADWLVRDGKPKYDPAAGWGLEQWLKRYVRKYYNKNIRSKGGKERMFLTAGQAWVQMMAGGMFSQPWAYGGGFTDVAAVFGAFDRRKQISLGAPEDKLVVTGQSSMDLLYRSSRRAAQIRDELSRMYGLAPDRPIIICAVPQHLEHGLLAADDHWALVDRLLSELAATGANIVLSLHPRSKPADYKSFAAAHGAVIAQQPLIEIIAAGDLFVAAMSSTVRWAILLRIPAIVLDDFAMGGDSMFEGSGVCFLQQRDRLAETARDLLSNADAINEMKRRLDLQSPDLDPFDGHNAARVAELITAGTPDTLNHHSRAR